VHLFFDKRKKERLLYEYEQGDLLISYDVPHES
jgi:hypothetical protein